VVETPTAVRIQRPGAAGQAEELLGDVTNDAETVPETGDDTESFADTVFHLERQLQEFIADNLGSIPVNGKRLLLYSDGVSAGREYPPAAAAGSTFSPLTTTAIS